MADEIDLANEQADRWLHQALTAAQAAHQRLPPKGTCYYCETNFDPKDTATSKRLFCDLECSKAYEDEQRLLSRR